MAATPRHHFCSTYHAVIFFLLSEYRYPIAIASVIIAASTITPVLPSQKRDDLSDRPGFMSDFGLNLEATEIQFQTGPHAKAPGRKIFSPTSRDGILRLFPFARDRYSRPPLPDIPRHSRLGAKQKVRLDYLLPFCEGTPLRAAVLAIIL